MEYIKKTIESIDKFLVEELGFAVGPDGCLWTHQDNVPVGQMVINGRAQYQMAVRDIRVSTSKDYACYDCTNTDENTEDNYLGLNVSITVTQEGEGVQSIDQICKSADDLKDLFTRR